jgi:hypothetical protein
MSHSTSPVAKALRLAASTVVLGAVLFLAAGTMAWPAAWGYLAVITVVLGVYSLVAPRMHPELVDERRHPPADAKRWDRPFAAIVGIVGPIALILLSGFDRRHQWSPPTPPWVQIVGLVAGAAGGLFTNYAVSANRFFSARARGDCDDHPDRIRAGRPDGPGGPNVATRARRLCAVRQESTVPLRAWSVVITLAAA